MSLYVARLKECGKIDCGTAGPDEDAVRVHTKEIYEQLPEYEVIRFLPASEYDTLGLVARGFIERAEKERDRMSPVVEAAVSWATQENGVTSNQLLQVVTEYIEAGQPKCGVEG